MNKRISRTSTLALMLTIAALGPAQAAGPAGADARAARVLNSLRDMTGVPGMSAAIWRDGTVVWSGAAGFQDAAKSAPVTEATYFRLASVSKVFAATAAAKLAEQGVLDVDAPVQTMIDGLNPAWPSITSRQLAANISGIPHYQDVDESIGARRYDSAVSSLEVFKDRALLFPPGTDYNYSTFGFTLLSAVVETQAKTHYLEYLAKHLTPDLEIGADRTNSGLEQVSSAFDYGDSGLFEAPPIDYSYSWGGAGLAGTARGVATFGGRLLRGDIVRAGTLAWMTQPALLASGSPAAERDFEVGFGWRISKDILGEPIVHHAGVTAGARSALVLHPEKGAAASILSNAPWVAAIEATAVTLAAPFIREAPVEERACPADAGSYVGKLNEAPISGKARFRIDDGVCVGELSIDGDFADWLNGFPQGDARELALISFDRGEGFTSGAIVTPIGAFEISAEGDAYVARIGASRALRFTLHSD